MRMMRRHHIVGSRVRGEWSASQPQEVICFATSAVIRVRSLGHALSRLVCTPTPPEPMAGLRPVCAPHGSDRHGRGTARHPFHSVGRLDRALRPGQTGCLLPGTYGGIHTMSRLRRSGTSDRRITITSYPVGRATVVGYLALEGSYMTVSHLRIDGSNTLLNRAYRIEPMPPPRLRTAVDRRP